MGRQPLRRTLTVAVAAVALMVILVSGVASLLLLRGNLLGQLDQELAAASSAPPIGGVPAGQPGPPAGLDQPGREVGTIIYRDPGADGRDVAAGVVTDSLSVSTLSGAQAQALAELSADGVHRTVTLPELGSYRVVAEQDSLGITVTGLPMAQARDTLRTTALWQLLVGAVGVLAIAALSAWLIRRALRPLRDVETVASQVSEAPLASGDVQLDMRTRVDDPATEVGQVGHALNTLLDHVEESLSAREASERKVRQFVADASHELRTPLASVRGYTELLQSRDLEPADQRAALERIASESQRMSELVEDLLLLARLDAGRTESATEVDLAAVATDAVMDAHVTSPDHSFDLDFELDEEVSFRTRGNEARLRQVVGNLLSNARVHTPAGTTVTVFLAAEPDAVVLTVSDDGPGIPAAEREKIFDRFARGDASRHRTSGTSGLGLPIARAIVESSGGSLTLGEGPGATFILRMPAA